MDNALHRLKFVRQHLDYQPSAAEAIRYLRETHAKYLPDVAVVGNATDDHDRDGLDGGGIPARPDAPRETGTETTKTDATPSTAKPASVVSRRV
jgi:hypothetical protein